jgi:hypothetical protein
MVDRDVEAQLLLTDPKDYIEVHDRYLDPAVVEEDFLVFSGLVWRFAMTAGEFGIDELKKRVRRLTARQVILPRDANEMEELTTEALDFVMGRRAERGERYEHVVTRSGDMAVHSLVQLEGRPAQPDQVQQINTEADADASDRSQADPQRVVLDVVAASRDGRIRQDALIGAVMRHMGIGLKSGPRL